MHNGSISLVVADDYEPITQSVDLAGIFARSNFIRKQTVEVYHRYEWFNGFYTRLGLEYSTRSSIEGLQFAQWTNDLFGARNQPAPFETYTVAQLGIEVLIRPFSVITSKEGEKLCFRASGLTSGSPLKEAYQIFLGAMFNFQNTSSS